jgi:hypothetical protein
MNWSVTVRVLRDTALSDPERDRLLAHVRQVRDGNGPNAWDLDVATGEPVAGVVAGTRLDLYYRDANDADVEHLCAALTALRGVLEGARTEVCDSYELLGWNPARARYETMGNNDVRRFGFDGGPGFVRLGSLGHHHRFADARITHTAARVELPATPESETALAIDGEPVFVDDVRHGERRRVLAAWLHHQGAAAGPPLLVDRVEATLLDAGGIAVDHDDENLGLHLRRHARLLVTVPGPLAAQRLAKTISLVATTEQTFEHALGRYTVARGPGAMTLQASPSTEPCPFPVTLALSGVIDVEQPDRNWRFVLELAARQAAVRVRVDVHLDLRDAQGRTLAEVRRSLELVPGPGAAATRVAIPVWHGAHELGDVTSVEVTGRFEVTRRVALGAWALPQ